MLTNGLTDDERFLVNHVTMFGSDGYPVRRLGRKWVWGPVRSVKGPPCTFDRKRDAVASFEAWVDAQNEKYAAARQADALAGRS